MTGASVRRFFRPALQIGLPLAAAALATTALAQQQTGSIKMPPLLAPPSSAAAMPEKALDTSEWMALPIDDLRRRAHAGETRAMEELARRLVSGIGIPQDSQSGAGWLLRAAEGGSPGAAFNVGVMYERGFVVERDSTRAVEWYQKAVDGNVAVAKHNLALLLREGRGTPRDATRAIDLLQSAARQGMTASMFTLGDIYERGDVAPKDLPLALAWFTVTVEFERRRGHGAESPLARTAQQRIDTMKRVLTPAELERSDKLAQMEQHAILAALTPRPEPLPPVSAAEPPPNSDEAIGWPNGAVERVRAIQQALIDLHRLRDKADGVAGPMTRTAIREFERAAGMPEAGEPTRDLYVALLRALQAQKDTVARSPLPPPPRTEPPKPQVAKVEAPPPPPPPKIETAPPPARPEPPTRTEAPPPAPVEAAKAAEPPPPQALKVEAPPPPPLRIELAGTEPPPPPPTSADIASAMPKPEPKPDPEGWTTDRVEQIRATQALLAELKLINFQPDGDLGPLTLNALRSYQRKAGLGESGEPSRALYLKLKADRDEAARRPPPPAPIDIGRTEPPPPPPTSADFAKAIAAARPPAEPDGWPASQVEQIRAVQALMAELKLVNFAPTGELGPMTRAALRDYQRKAGLGESGEPSRALYLKLKADRDEAARRPPPPAPIDIGRTEPPPPPPTSADIAPAMPRPELKPDPEGWPTDRIEQVRATQALMAELKLINFQPDGDLGPLTLNALRSYQRKAGLGESGEPSRALYLKLKAERDEAARRPPPTSADVAKAVAAARPPAEPDGWPASQVEQIRAVQSLLAELKLVNFAPTGELGPMTRAALRDYQRKAGLGESGELSRALYLKLKADRDDAARRPPPPVAIDIGKTEPPPPPPTSADIARLEPKAAPRKAATPEPDGWPASHVEQIRAVQSLLAELKLVNFAPTGELGPMTRAALRDYQRKAGLGESGEPSRALYLRLKADRDEAARRPPPPAPIDIGKTEPPPPPPTSADIAKVEPKTEPKPDPHAWPASRTEQVRAIQGLLRDLKLFDLKPNGNIGPLTTAAIRDYQRMAGMPQTGEPTRALFESLKEMVEMTAPRPAGKRN